MMVSLGLASTSNLRKNGNVGNCSCGNKKPYKHSSNRKQKKRNKTKNCKMIYPLHSKGMMLLAFVFLTEHLRAVRIVDASTTHHPGGKARFYRSDPTADPLSCANTGSCPAGGEDPSTSPTPPTNKSTSPNGPTVAFGLSSHDDEGAERRITVKNNEAKRIEQQQQQQNRHSHHHHNNNKNVADCCQDFHRCASKSNFPALAPSVLLEECIVHGSLPDVPRGGAAAEVVENVSSVISNTLPFNIPVNGWKIIFQALLTTINVVCWLVPLRSKSFGQNELMLSLANAFSGGVFLSLAFGHLIPECVHEFTSLSSSTMNEATPYMLVLGGYMLIFFVEKVAFDAHGALHEMEHGAQEKNKKLVNGNKKRSTTDNKNKDDCEAECCVAHNSGRSALILLAALGVHSVLEMAALGLSDSFSDSAILTISIALHQPAESIALLVAFLKSGMPKKQIITYLTIFSIMGPIGTGLGIMVNEFADPIVDSIMLAIVAGTFVYVGATEVIPEEFEEPKNKWKKFTALMSGIVSIFAITQYTMTLEM